MFRELLATQETESINDVYTYALNLGISQNALDTLLEDKPWLSTALVNWKYLLHSLFNTGYTPLLKGDGVAYINTGLTPQTVTKASITFKTDESGKQLFGCEVEGTNGFYAGYLLYRKLYAAYGNGSNLIEVNADTYDDNLHTLILEDGDLIWDGTSFSFPSTAFSAYSNIYLYTKNKKDITVDDRISSAYVKEFILYNSLNEEIWHGVPYFQNSVFGMLDLVSGNFFTSSVEAGLLTYTLINPQN